MNLKRFELEAFKWSKHISRLSHDKTKIGCTAYAISRFEKTNIADGYNHLPYRFSNEDIDKYLSDRDLKNRFITHAEIDCICNASLEEHNPNTVNLYIWGLA